MMKTTISKDFILPPKIASVLADPAAVVPTSLVLVAPPMMGTGIRMPPITDDGRLVLRKLTLPLHIYYISYFGVPYVMRKDGFRPAYVLYYKNKRRIVRNKPQLLVLIHDGNSCKLKLSRAVAMCWSDDFDLFRKEVHHIDLDVTNNCIENLQVLTPEDHRAIHKDLRKAAVRRADNLNH